MHKQLKYSIAWAAGVFEAFAGCYPRATELALEALAITPRSMTRWLAQGGPSWEKFKKLAMVMEKWLNHQAAVGKPCDGKMLLGSLVDYGVREGLLNRRIVLTRLEKRDTIQGHVSIGAFEPGTPGEKAHLMGVDLA